MTKAIQRTIYDELERRELEEGRAEEEAVMVTPVVAAVYCIRCREPITPQGWCPCKIKKEGRRNELSGGISC